MALPKPSLLSAAQASSQALDLREVMKTFEQPDWMRLVLCIRMVVSNDYGDVESAPGSCMQSQSS
jgi:hypothetical protein